MATTASNSKVLPCPVCGRDATVTLRHMGENDDQAARMTLTAICANRCTPTAVQVARLVTELA